MQGSIKQKFFYVTPIFSPDIKEKKTVKNMSQVSILYRKEKKE